MTLFDVIRYPISDPPTEDQLAALPKQLYRNWVDNPAVGNACIHLGPVWISIHLNLLHRNDLTVYRNIMNLLRQLILEYDQHL